MLFINFWSFKTIIVTCGLLSVLLLSRHERRRHHGQKCAILCDIWYVESSGNVMAHGDARVGGNEGETGEWSG